MDSLVGMFPFIIPIVTIIAVFTFVTVQNWAEERRKEREAYYRHEVEKKALEAGGQQAAMVFEQVRREEAARLDRRREGLKLGGIIVSAIGAGLMAGLSFIEDVPVWRIGLVPLAVGAALLAYALTWRPKAS